MFTAWLPIRAAAVGAGIPVLPVGCIALALESLLGIHLEEGKQLRLTPHLPADWNNITVDYRFGETLYRIAVSRAAAASVALDGVTLENNIIPLQDDRQPHQVGVKCLK